MRPTVIDRVAWSVCHSSEPCKNTEPMEITFGLKTWVDPINHALDEVQISPIRRGNFEGSGGPL